MSILATISLLMLFSPIQYTNPNPIQIEFKTYESISDTIDYYSAQYEANPDQLKAIMMCESSGRIQVLGDNGKACGLFQFHKPTWEMFEKKMGKDLEYCNPVNEIEMTAWAFANGYESHWSCFEILKTK